METQSVIGGRLLSLLRQHFGCTWGIGNGVLALQHFASLQYIVGGRDRTPNGHIFARIMPPGHPEQMLAPPMLLWPAAFPAGSVIKANGCPSGASPDAGGGVTSKAEPSLP